LIVCFDLVSNTKAMCCIMWFIFQVYRKLSEVLGLSDGQFISFREEDLWNFSQSEHIIGHGSHIEYPTGTKNSNFVEDHPRNIPAKFGSSSLVKCKYIYVNIVVKNKKGYLGKQMFSLPTITVFSSPGLKVHVNYCHHYCLRVTHQIKTDNQFLIFPRSIFLILYFITTSVITFCYICIPCHIYSSRYRGV
jgi:hypothetical protein